MMAFKQASLRILPKTLLYDALVVAFLKIFDKIPLNDDLPVVFLKNIYI
jgi:hypothetical protein